MKQDPYLIHDTKVNSKWIKKLNLRYEIITSPKENLNATWQDIGLGEGFLDKTLNAQTVNQK